MELTELKKELYKTDPTAELLSVRKDGILYGCYLSHFLVPLSEIGEVIWQPEMKAKLLIRYIVPFS